MFLQLKHKELEVYKTSRELVKEVLDAALETAVDLKYFSELQLKIVGTLLNKCFAMLSKMISK